MHKKCVLAHSRDAFKHRLEHAICLHTSGPMRCVGVPEPRCVQASACARRRYSNSHALPTARPCVRLRAAGGANACASLSVDKQQNRHAREDASMCTRRGDFRRHSACVCTGSRCCGVNVPTPKFIPDKTCVFGHGCTHLRILTAQACVLPGGPYHPWCESAGARRRLAHAFAP